MRLLNWFSADLDALWDRDYGVCAAEKLDLNCPPQYVRARTRAREFRNMASRRGGRKLSREAIAFVLDAIVAGRSNQRINAGLVTRGYLPEGDQLSKQALWRYRKDKRVQEAIAAAIEENRQVARRRFSRRVVNAVEMNNYAAERLLDDDGVCLRALKPAEQRALLRLFMRTAKFLFNLPWDEWERQEEQARAAAAAAEERKRVDAALMEHLREIFRKVHGNMPEPGPPQMPAATSRPEAP